mmetsp:Transcript_18824/g.36944  ORF Transcript_18824/g.36944 Transcript_18824/m.36944 type:complete len:96 (-) Transcript_18824:978-1265(-)
MYSGELALGVWVARLLLVSPATTCELEAMCGFFDLGVLGAAQVGCQKVGYPSSSLETELTLPPSVLLHVWNRKVAVVNFHLELLCPPCLHNYVAC